MRFNLTATRAFALVVALALLPAAASAKTANVIDAEVDNALAQLFSTNATAEELGSQAKGILVFPDVTKVGLVVGGGGGVGALLAGGETAGYYQTASGSIGLQAGIENRSEVIMFMTEQALADFRQSDNWEAGVDGSITVVETGASGEITTGKQPPIIGFIFGNEGLFAGLNFEGSKISDYRPE